MTFWAASEGLRRCFREGYEASVDADGVPNGGNPYELGTPEWMAWNAGWNEHYEERWDEEADPS